jgi:hypothetical protein
MPDWISFMLYIYTSYIKVGVTYVYLFALTEGVVVPTFKRSGSGITKRAFLLLFPPFITDVAHDVAESKIKLLTHVNPIYMCGRFYGSYCGLVQ